MSTERIRSALGVAAWPPDHYAILGLAPGPVDPAEVERRAAERTERLRPYQLTEPDAATDALNRVAQALVCLTDRAARRAYDARAAPPAVIPVAPLVMPTPVRLPKKLRVVDPRREPFRALVAARRLRAAWRRLGPLLNEAPARTLDRTTSTQLLRELWLIRRLCGRDDAPPLAADGQPGSLILSLARRPRILRTVRAFGERDRTRVAADWQAGAERLDAHVRSVNAHLRRTRRRRWRLWGRRVAAHAIDGMLVLFGLAALATAIALATLIFGSRRFAEAF